MPALTALLARVLWRGAVALPLVMSTSAAGGQHPERPPACVVSAPRAGGTAAADSGRGAMLRDALDPCMRAMHAGMHAALADRAGDADALFAAAMIPHHQGAVDMARQLLLHGRDPALRAFALGVIAEQQAEIDMLRAWIARRGAAASAPPGGADVARARAAPVDGRREAGPAARAHTHPERPAP